MSARFSTTLVGVGCTARPSKLDSPHISATQVSLNVAEESVVKAARVRRRGEMNERIVPNSSEGQQRLWMKELGESGWQLICLQSDAKLFDY